MYNCLHQIYLWSLRKGILKLEMAWSQGEGSFESPKRDKQRYASVAVNKQFMYASEFTIVEARNKK